MSDQNMRPAVSADLNAMAGLKCRRLSEQLSCFMPSEVLSRMTPEHFLQSLKSMLEQACFQIDVHEESGEADGYVIYARLNENEPWSQIVEVFATSCELQQALIDRTLGVMRGQGAERVHVWIIRENFQLRFMYEMSGFRFSGIPGSKRFMERDFPAVLYQRTL